MAGADNSLTYDDCSDDSDEGFEQGDCLNGSPQDDPALSPLERIRKIYSATDCIIFYRENVANVVQEFFRSTPAECVARDLPEVMEMLARMGEESLVRSELLQQIPSLATCALECSGRVEALKDVVVDHLLPIVLQNLSSNDRAVNMVAHRALISLIEKGYINKTQTEIKVCPAVLAMSNSEISLDIHTGCIMLMSRLAPLLGRDVTERVFLGRFCDMCGSHMFYLRKICSTHIGDLAAVVSKTAFEKYLLPRFLELCIDDIWGVRKSCAESMVFISCASTLEMRKKILAPIFSKLLRDECRWVKISAYQALGPFITTFAYPPITRLGYTDARELTLECWDGSEFLQIPVFKISSPYESNVMYPKISKNEVDLLLDPEGPPLNLPAAEKSRFDVERAKKAAVTLTRLQDESQKPAVELLVEDFRKNVKESGEVMENVFDYHRKGLAQLGSEEGPEEPAKQVKVRSKCVLTNTSESDNDLSMFNSYNYWYISPDLVEVDLGLLDKESGGKEVKIETEDIGQGDQNKVRYEIELCKEEEEVKEENTLENDTCQFDAANECLKPQCDPCNILDKTNESNDDTESDNNSTLDELLLLEKLTEDIELESDNVVNGSIDLANKDPLNTNSPNEQLNAEPPKPEQTIVPQELIDHFTSMTDPNIAMEIDNEASYHCAFALPAVALTLGSENWYLLKGTVESLADDMQYKVRRTVACSLHELAMILGPQITTDCLMPLFDGFLKDLDEVRIGVLKNLAHFLKLISPEKRTQYLPKLKDFLVTDNEWNWRFRAMLAKQLIESVPLYSSVDACKYLSVIAGVLMCDKVATVRQMALQLVCEILRHIAGEPALVSNALVTLAEKFAHSKNWRMRQMFALLCKEMLQQDVIDLELFASDVMPHLLDLSWDAVANVRVVVGVVLSKHIFTNEYFCNPENDHLDSLETVLRRLQADKDRDVRDFATLGKA